jgi:hypothetical protein
MEHRPQDVGKDGVGEPGFGLHGLGSKNEQIAGQLECADGVAVLDEQHAAGPGTRTVEQLLYRCAKLFRERLGRRLARRAKSLRDHGPGGYTGRVKTQEAGCEENQARRSAAAILVFSSVVADTTSICTTC